MYDRTSTLLGFHSIYVEKPISRMIGEVYLGWAAGCNTGLVGGCMFCFGYLAAIISTFGYIMAFRLYEGTIATFQNPKQNIQPPTNPVLHPAAHPKYTSPIIREIGFST